MRITEDCINHNAVQIIKNLVAARYDMIMGGEEYSGSAERGYLLMTFGEIGGVIEMAETMKEVLKA